MEESVRVTPKGVNGTVSKRCGEEGHRRRRPRLECDDRHEIPRRRPKGRAGRGVGTTASSDEEKRWAEPAVVTPVVVAEERTVRRRQKALGTRAKGRVESASVGSYAPQSPTVSLTAKRGGGRPEGSGIHKARGFFHDFNTPTPIIIVTGFVS